MANDSVLSGLGGGGGEVTVIGGSGPQALFGAPEDKIAALQWPLPSLLNVWNTSDQAPLTMTYQFATTSQPGDLSAGFSGWTAFTEAQKNAVRSVLAEFSEVINVNFVEVAGQADPDINLGRVSLSYGGQGGFLYSYSYVGTTVTSKTYDGYAVFNSAYGLLSQDDRSLMLHEIGHTMSLKHPGNYDVGGSPPPGPYLPSAEDNNKYTVMSYNAHPASGLDSDHLMLYDIAALQARWGARLTTRTGNDTYTGPDGRAKAIWDGGGVDTIDASGQTGSVVIDLNQGAFSSIGGTDNMSIAYGVTVENAIGGSGNDTIIGNNAANVLKGGSGADRLFGGDGDDTIFWDPNDVLADVQGGNGIDTLVITSGSAPTSFSLTGHGFDAAKLLLSDTAGTQTWSTNTTNYNTAWQTISNIRVNDNGTQERTYFDVGDAFYWANYTDYHNAQGYRTLQQNVHDDATRHRTYYDWDANLAGGTNDYWSTYQDYLNAAGHVTWQQNNHDDGSYHRTYFDWDASLAGGVNDYWSSYTDNYSATHQKLSQFVNYDNGDYHRRYFDVSNNLYWSNYVDYYHADNTLYRKTVYHDNGTVTDTFF